MSLPSGGISLKPGASMDKMRADMGGAANVFATLYTLSRLNVKLPFNIIGLTPLVENMPGGKATKPGDIVFARNGKSIKVCFFVWSDCSVLYCIVYVYYMKQYCVNYYT